MSDHRPSERMLIAPARSEQWKLLLHDRNFDSCDESCIDQISILFSSRLLICPICLYFRRPSKKKKNEDGVDAANASPCCRNAAATRSSVDHAPK